MLIKARFSHLRRCREILAMVADTDKASIKKTQALFVTSACGFPI
jgi:hypothetical protein